MTWPAVQVKTNFDQSSDDPKVARSDLAGNVDKFNQLQAHVSSYIQGLLDDADAAAARTTLGVVIGTDVQALDATLTSLAAVAGVAGDIFYASGTDVWAKLVKGTDGEVLTLASGIPSWAATAAITRGSRIATTSGTTKTFTGIAAGANRITFMFDGVSLSGTDTLRIRLGDAGGIETSGYLSGASTGTTSKKSTVDFIITNDSADVDHWSGIIVFTRINDKTWVSSGMLDIDGDNDLHISGGTKTLSAELTQIQIKSSGSDTFDLGQINIFTE